MTGRIGSEAPPCCGGRGLAGLPGTRAGLLAATSALALALGAAPAAAQDQPAPIALPEIGVNAAPAVDLRLRRPAHQLGDQDRHAAARRAAERDRHHPAGHPRPSRCRTWATCCATSRAPAMRRGRATATPRCCAASPPPPTCSSTGCATTCSTTATSTTSTGWRCCSGPNAMIFGRGGTGGVINRVTKQADWEPAARGAAAGRLLRPVARQLRPRPGDQRERRLPRAGHVRGERQLPRRRQPQALRHQPDLRLPHRRPDRHPRLLRIFPRRAHGGSRHPVLQRPAARDRTRHLLRRSGPQPGECAGQCAEPRRLEHRFDNGVLLRNSFRFADYDKFYQNVFPGAVSANGSTVAINAYNNATHRTT